MANRDLQKGREDMNTLHIEGMMCEGCVKRVVEGLQKAGIEATVSLEDKTVAFEGNDSIVALATSEIEDLGFDVV